MRWRTLEEESPSLWYWIGLLMADGCVSSSTYGVTLTSKDIEIVQNFKDFLQLPFAICYNTKNGTPYFQVGRKRLHELLISKFDLRPRKSQLDYTPNINIPDPFKAEYVRGFLDGDGCVTWFKTPSGKRIPSIVFANHSLKLLSFINQLILDGINITLRIGKGGLNTLHLKVNGWRAREVLGWIYANSTPTTRLTRKYLKAQDMQSWRGKHEMENIS